MKLAGLIGLIMGMQIAYGATPETFHFRGQEWWVQTKGTHAHVFPKVTHELLSKIEGEQETCREFDRALAQTENMLAYRCLKTSEKHKETVCNLLIEVIDASRFG